MSGRCGARGRCIAHGLEECWMGVEPEPIPEERSWDENGADVATGWVVAAILALVAILTMVAVIINYLI